MGTLPRGSELPIGQARERIGAPFFVLASVYFTILVKIFGRSFELFSVQQQQLLLRRSISFKL
jgi:hypothetical protein